MDKHAAGCIGYQPGLEALAAQLSSWGYTVTEQDEPATPRTYLYKGALHQAVHDAPPGSVLVDVAHLDPKQVAFIVDRRLYSPIF